VQLRVFTDYELDEREIVVQFPAVIRDDFSLFQSVLTGSGVRIQLLGGSSFRINRPGRKANHSPPYSADVKNTRSYTTTSLIRLRNAEE
jgi:hypothetical protein